VSRDTELSAAEVSQIATEAYEYFYPLVLMDITRKISTNFEAGARPGAGPMNAWSHMRAFPPGDFKEVVRPNFDTLYSIVWLNMTEEPIIISAPDTHGRYYMLPVIDMWTDVVSVPGKRTSGTGAGYFALTGPGWAGELPEGVAEIRVPTPYAWIIGRTQTNGPKDYEAVHAVQDALGLSLLSDWGRQPQTPTFTFDPTVDMKTPPLDQVNRMTAAQFFTYAAELLKLHPPHVTDGSMVLRMKRIGVECGADFDYGSLDAETQTALADGARAALQEMRGYSATRTTPRNGWAVHAGAIGVYGNDYLGRAVIAMIGLGANPAEDAIYPLNVADSGGRPLRGEDRNILRFDADKLPPVGAFWSVTMYDAEGFPVVNEMDRYAIGDRDDLTFNEDGSLDIYLQHESPGVEREANWLPSPPAGVLGVTMRLYEPAPEALSGEWWPPAVVRVP
jgi:hypothetical protein